ncbi:MAG: metal ABC transporter permease, partial [Thermoguttaceae bacterium]|nr:metal ABC transporter permease [Thermoguttaceae bacterium]
MGGMTLQLLTLPEYQFLRWAFLLSAMASLSFGLIGSFVVVRRIGYLAGAISHCAFGGIGIGIWIQQAIAGGGLGISLFLTASGENRAEQLKTAAGYADPTLIATFFAILAAFLIGFLQKHAKEREDSIIGMIWATGMALGLLFLDRTTGYVSISGYLFGDIVLISASDMLTVGILGSCVLLVSLIFFHRLEAVCFDEEFA